MSELLWERLPILVHSYSAGKANSPPVRLVPLPRGSEVRLSQAIGIPRAGMIGIARDAPGTDQLIDLVRNLVDPIVVPWLKDIDQGNYRPTMTNVKTMEVSNFPKKKTVPKKATAA